MLRRLFICLAGAGIASYAYIAQHNALTELRMEIPKLVKEVRMLQEENSQLDLEVRRYKSPQHLLQLAQRPEFSHLRYPTEDEVYRR